MASEDSDELVPGFTPVHRLHHLDDLDETVSSLVVPTGHQLDAVSELLKVEPFGRSERMLPKERNNPFEQILATTDDVAVEMLPVVGVPPVDVHLSRSKELAELVETIGAARALCHHEIMRDLVSGFVAPSARTVWLPYEPDREASFSVYKTDHPTTELDQPFLLIFRTRHVVTVDIRPDIIVVRDTRVFQHIAKCAPRRYQRGGQRFASKDIHMSFSAMSP